MKEIWFLKSRTWRTWHEDWLECWDPPSIKIRPAHPQPTPVLECPRKHQAHEAPEDWTGFKTKSALLAGFALLVPVMLSLFTFRQAQKESKDLPGEQPEIQTEIKRGRAWVPYVVLLALLILALAAGMVFKFFPLFFINIYGMSVVQISVVQAIEPLVKACFTYLVGVCAPVVGRAEATSLCMVGVIGCLLGLSIQREEGTHLLSSLALFMFRGSLAQASFALAWAILMDCVPASQRGRWSSSCTVSWVWKIWKCGDHVEPWLKIVAKHFRKSQKSNIMSV